MIHSLLSLLHDWAATADARQKLQHTYVTGGVALLVIAGLVGLVNYGLGQGLLLIALAAIAIFFINAIAWALLTAFVLLPLSTNKPAPAAKPRSRSK